MSRALAISTPADPGPPWAELLLAAALLWAGRLALREPVLPDAADCAARGRPADCWRQALGARGEP